MNDPILQRAMARLRVFVGEKLGDDRHDVLIFQFFSRFELVLQ